MSDADDAIEGVSVAYLHMARVLEPMHEFALGQRNKFIAEGWSVAVAEQMAAQVFVYTLTSMMATNATPRT